jgi:hypothetical protein
MNVGNVHLYSPNLHKLDEKLTGVNIIRNLDEFVESRVLKNLDLFGESSLAIIPEGPYVVPILN